MPMNTPNPAQHGRLILRQLAIPEAPGMDPQLLPVEIPNLEHAQLSQQRISMTPTPTASHKPRNALLVPQQGPPQGQVPPLLEIPPHHQAILEVREDQTIIE